MSQATFPPEILDMILSNLSGSLPILDCALVCRSWMPFARNHLLPLDSKVLVIDQGGLTTLVDLAKSPYFTLSFVSVNALNLDQNTPWNSREPSPDDEMDDFDSEWKSSTAISDFLEKGPLFSSIKSLSLISLNWKTLSSRAITSLNTDYTSLRDLELQFVLITFPDLFDLLAGFTALEKIKIGDGLPFYGRPWTPASSPRLTHPNLRKLDFEHPPTPSTVESLCRGIEYSRGIHEVILHLSVLHQWSEYKDCCGELMSAAGQNLRVLTLRARYDTLTMSSENNASLAEFLSFPQNPKLQEIYFKEFSEDTLKLFVIGLTSKPKPYIRQLKFRLDGRNDFEQWSETWVLVDQALSSMPLKDPTLIVECPTFSAELLEPILPNYPGNMLGMSNYLYSKVTREEVLETLERILPRVSKSWKMDVILCDLLR